MADQPYVQIPLRQAYIGHSWSRVSHRARSEVRKLVRQSEVILAGAGLRSFIGRRDNATGAPSDRLLRARFEMRRSELYLLILAAQSDGAIEELRSADAARTPVVCLRRKGVLRPRISDWPSLRLLDDLMYETCDQAATMLRAFLDAQQARLAELAELLANSRGRIARAQDLGAAVRREREARGMSLDRLARLACLPRAAVAAIERAAAANNPPYEHVQAIAQALGIDIGALTLPADEWAGRQADKLSTEIAFELDWPVRLLHAFSAARWTEIRYSEQQLEREAMRTEMIWFQRRWEQQGRDE